GVSATDPESGVASIAFPDVFGSDSATATGATATQTYSWNAGATAFGTKSVTVTNAAGLTVGGPFTVTPDSTPPSGGSVVYGDGYTATEAVPLTLSPGTDAVAGVATTGAVLQRASATLANGSCGTFGA